MTKRPTDVYIGGFIQRLDTSSLTGISSIAKYWKNGQPYEVTNASDGWVIIESMTIVGSDIYLVGYVNILGIRKPKYWKNGIGFQLPSAQYDDTRAMCLAISGNDIYVGGSSSSLGAQFWKNGVLVPLDQASTYLSNISAIAISGDDVYVAGRSDQGDAVYWKNGVITKLDNPYSYVTGIAVSGGDVYVLGTFYGSLLANGFSVGDVALFWKNGVGVALSNGALDSGANSIVVDGTDVYIAGYTTNGVIIGSYSQTVSIATYWKNNTPVVLMQNGVASGIAIDGNDIHVIGMAGANQVPMYWKNGIGTVIGVSDSLGTDHLTSIALSR